MLTSETFQNFSHQQERFKLRHNKDPRPTPRPELTWMGSSILTAALLPSILLSTLYTFPYVPFPIVSMISQVSVGSGKLSKTIDFPDCGNIFRSDLLRSEKTRGVTVQHNHACLVFRVASCWFVWELKQKHIKRLT